MVNIKGVKSNNNGFNDHANNEYDIVMKIIDDIDISFSVVKLYFERTLLVSWVLCLVFSDILFADIRNIAMKNVNSIIEMNDVVMVENLVDISKTLGAELNTICCILSPCIWVDVIS